jgi:hypothetical protein
VPVPVQASVQVSVPEQELLQVPVLVAVRSGVNEK